MTITLGPELEAALSEAARREGVSPDALALNVLRERFLAPAPAMPSPDEWRQGILETAGKWQGPFQRPQDEWERGLLELAKDCGLSLSNEILSREELYE